MDRTKKIAFVANSTWNIYNFRLALIKAFLKKGFQVIVIAPVDEYIHYLNKTPGLTHIPLKHLSRKSKNPLKDISLFLELWNIYKKHQPDLIIHYTVKPNIWGNFAACFSRIPSVCVVTGLGYSFLHQRSLRNFTELLYRISFRLAQAVIFKNKDDRSLFIEKQIVKREQAYTVPGSGVNIKHFSPRKFSPSDNRKVFTFIGRLLYDKGIVEFVEAAKRVHQKCPNADFWVIGDIDEGNPSFVSKAQLVRWIENKTICYYGIELDVRPVISQSDCIVLPSYREGLSMVLLEAMAMGKPVITTDTPGCRQTVDSGKNGFLVPVKNSEALALAIETYCNLSETQTRQMGQHSRYLAQQRYAQQVAIDSYFSVFEKVTTWPLRVAVKKHV